MGKASYQKEYIKNMTDEQKQKFREARKHKYHNMTDEQKQKYKDYLKDYQKEYRKNMTDEKKKQNIKNLESINVIIWLLNKSENI